MSLTRRTLLGATLVTAMRPLAAGAAPVPLPRDAEVVVIGAGAAGIAAARRIVAANRKVVVLEADSRIGGRCSTDTSSFGIPADRGARWIYNADAHPLGRLVRVAGMDLASGTVGQKIRIGRRNARAGEAEDFLATLVRANRAIDDGAKRSDIACAALLPKDLGDWAGATEFLLGPSAMGRDLKELSSVDQSRAERHEAAATPRQGLGSLVAKLAEGLPVSLQTPATRIVFNPRDMLAVETPAGVINARAVILTASPDVLLSGKIKLPAEFPKRVLDAAARLTLGSYDRIFLEFTGNPLGLGRDDVMIEQSQDVRTGLLTANVGGSSLCTIDVAGGFGRTLSGQGEAAMIAFGTEWLTKLFGSDIAGAVKRSAATRWTAQPWCMGAMSAALPGGAAGRRLLMEPIGPLFLAGDAVHETAYGTVGGAWLSGERAAEAALKKIGAMRPVAEPAPAAPSKSGRRNARPDAGVRSPGMAWPRS